MKYKDLLDSFSKARQDRSFDTVNIAVISNICLEPFFSPSIAKIFSDCNVYPNVISIPYDEYGLPEYIESLKTSDLVVVWLNCEVLFSLTANGDQQITNNTMNTSQTLHDTISRVTNAKIIWFLFEDYFERIPIVIGHCALHNDLINKINFNLFNALKDTVVCVDLKRLIAEVGIANAYHSKGKHRWNAPYSSTLIEVAVQEIYKQYLIEQGITKKCLVLDCDNVLWGGVLSEDGIENIELGRTGLGRAYQEFQNFVLSLYYHGVILAICSKNDVSDVMTMFHEHSEMILKEEYIAVFQVNWENKPDNIRRIAETLNIDMNSIVFIDDSHIETEAVKAMIPEVTTILYKPETIYEQLSCFNLKSDVNISSIEKRNATYQTNQSREALKSQFDTYNDYINALEIKVDIHKVMPIEFSRVSELTQRTNKCTNGIRYTVADIKERTNANNITMYSISVSDRFSDLGLVGILEVEDSELTLFSLSCRALGRGIEEKMIGFIESNHQIKTFKFCSTGKNKEIKDLLMKAFPIIS